jgi:hypothetical protein
MCAVTPIWQSVPIIGNLSLSAFLAAARATGSVGSGDSPEKGKYVSLKLRVWASAWICRQVRRGVRLLAPRKSWLEKTAV